ncbi:MAG: response regulator, partial [Thermodesulfobacteriota bacterium]|nr:response regulator [Thermodesulfobacteriota bacterium]
MEDMANVLVVDDELGPRESLKMILKPMFNVYTAKDGQEALEFIKEKSVNLVTLDLKMPGMSGIDVLKEIKKCNPNIEVIVLTGYGSMNTAVDALRCGALDYLTKPF